MDEEGHVFFTMRLVKGIELARVFDESDVRMWVTGLGSMLCVHAHDDRLLDLLVHHLLDEGIYIARRGFISLSAEIGDDDCDRLVAATEHWAHDRGARA